MDIVKEKHLMLTKYELVDQIMFSWSSMSFFILAYCTSSTLQLILSLRYYLSHNLSPIPIEILTEAVEGISSMGISLFAITCVLSHEPSFCFLESVINLP